MKNFQKKNKNVTPNFFFAFSFSFLKLKKKLLTFHGSILKNGRVIAQSLKSVCEQLCAPWCPNFFFFLNFFKIIKHVSRRLVFHIIIPQPSQANQCNQTNQANTNKSNVHLWKMSCSVSEQLLERRCGFLHASPLKSSGPLYHLV